MKYKICKFTSWRNLNLMTMKSIHGLLVAFIEATSKIETVVKYGITDPFNV